MHRSNQIRISGETTPETVRPVRSTLARTRLDWAIIASLLMMACFNLIMMADQFGATKAHAATPACSVRAPLA